MRQILMPIATALLLAGLAPVNAAPALRPSALSCEYRKNPEGIDARLPRLSWILEAADPSLRGLRQSAYRVLVASDPDTLARDQGDLWDSGRVESDQSNLVPYSGRPLASRAQCFWKVQAWDGDNQPSPWSEPARWSMGLLDPADWKGVWIGKDEAPKDVTVTGVEWIWTQEKPEPPGDRFFRRAFSVPAKRKLSRATIEIASDNRFVANINGLRVGQGGSFKSVTVYDLTPKLRPGANALAITVNNSGEHPNPAGLLVRLTIQYSDGTEVITTDSSWKSAKAEQAGWMEPGFDDTAWPAARAIGPAGMAPWGPVAGADDRRLPARWLRKEFLVGKSIRRATAHVCGLGLHELYVNGARVGDHVLSPALTQYNKRACYVTHDVTPLLKEGPNAIGAILGNGRFFAPRRAQPVKTGDFGYPKLLLHLDITFADGSTTTVSSDSSWKLTDAGPIRTNNEYDGEEYDARLEMPAWAHPGFDDSKWSAAAIVQPPGGAIVAQMIEPIRVVQTLTPVAVTEPKPGVFIFDMGQNMVGWCRMRVTGPAGAAVALRHAETLTPEGTLYMDNIRAARVTDIYTLKGGGQETWEPRFTYHGFRYVEVTGFPGRPGPGAIEGRVVHDDVAPAGDWACSNPFLNRLYTNILWGVSGNYRSILTDCPQRDERQGWLGDRSEESRGEAYLFHTAALHAKWLQDMEDAQKESGSVPDVCPEYWDVTSDSVTWPGTTVILPGHLNAIFGDTGILNRHYPSMKRWMDFMAAFLKDDLMPRDRYGDWCVPPEDPKLIHSQDPARKTAATLLGTSYFHHCAQLMARYAALTGRGSETPAWNALADRLRAAFNREFLKGDPPRYDNGAQTAQVLPLAFGLVPKERRGAIFDFLVEKISRESNNHIGTGLIGGQHLMRTLTANGRADLALTLASQRTYPSWGYMIDNGATTIWELWNGNTADPAMNSHNHVMLVGDLVIWLNENLAGIAPDTDRPGFKHIVMKPEPVARLEFVRATHRSPHGPIRSHWQRTAGALHWEVTIPPNTTATLHVPAASPDSVTESGKPATQAPGLKFLGARDGRVVFEAGSGRYRFDVR